jgi:hypothetical protein
MPWWQAVLQPLCSILINDGPLMQLEEAAAQLLLVCKKKPYEDAAFQYFGLAMAKRGRMRITYTSLLEAQRLNPENVTVKKALEQMPREFDRQALGAQNRKILLNVYPSQAPSKLTQLYFDDNGRSIADGIEVEWYDNGRIRRFLDVDWGVPNGLEINWAPDGRMLSRVAFRDGKRIDQ